jgi:Kdo2-lipid IVA lauroyltransferase/acyltransferase
MKNFIHALVYYCCIPFFYFFSILPWPLLFIFSDIFFLFIFYVIRYRRKIVKSNLSRSFPEKSRAELNEIEFRFYRYFSDTIFEIFKLFTLSPEQKIARCKMDTASEKLFADLYAKGRSAILVMGHYGNWEYSLSGISLQVDFQSYVVYHPLSNPYFERLIYRMRTSNSCRLYKMSDTYKGMVANRNEVTLNGFLGDQSPRPKNAYWTQFLNQETAIFIGTEKMAKKLQMAVVYGRMERVKRGKYIFHTQLICEDATQTEPYEITEAHVRLLEKDICHAPEFWLWTHRRWKHKRPE